MGAVCWASIVYLVTEFRELEAACVCGMEARFMGRSAFIALFGDYFSPVAGPARALTFQSSVKRERERERERWRERKRESLSETPKT